MSPQFRSYAQQVVTNARVLAETLVSEGFRLVSGGTDNHLMLVDVGAMGVTGKEAEEALGKAGITVNRNGIPFDTRPPMVASGVRIGDAGSDHSWNERARDEAHWGVDSSCDPRAGE